MVERAQRYVVVGNPVAHSLSPQIHAAFAHQCGENLTYEKAQVPLGGFAKFVDEFAAAGGRGLNVTVPFKGDAYDYVDEHDELAAAAHSVNTIALSDDGRSRGFNTDGVGLLRDLEERHRVKLEGAVVVVLGAGGATRGVVEPLLRARPRCLVIANRTVGKAREIVERFATEFPGMRACGLREELDAALSELGAGADVVINATSTGFSGGAPLVTATAVAGAFCYDMSYGAAAVFQGWARDNGAGSSVDGLGMLVEQAAQSFFIWRNKRPHTEPVLAALRRALETS